MIETFIANIKQDVLLWVMVAFTCCVIVWLAALIDLWTGVEAARANKEPISSHALRRTVAKVIDYLRPYFLIVCTLGVLLIEGRSVIENSRKKKSHAADILNAVEDIIKAATQQDAERIIKQLKEKEDKR